MKNVIQNLKECIECIPIPVFALSMSFIVFYSTAVSVFDVGLNHT